MPNVTWSDIDTQCIPPPDTFSNLPVVILQYDIRIVVHSKPLQGINERSKLLIRPKDGGIRHPVESGIARFALSVVPQFLAVPHRGFARGVVTASNQLTLRSVLGAKSLQCILNRTKKRDLMYCISKCTL